MGLLRDRSRRSTWLVLVAWASLAVSACAPTTVPIGQAEYPRAPTSATTRPRTLLVLLPGKGDDAMDFEAHGFIDAVRRSDFDVDVIAVDAHFGYYRNRTLPQRVHEDVLQPNRERYDQIWVLGISMGGIGALLTAQRHPGDVDGIILIAPYLGRRATLKAIDDAGGLAQWEPPADPAWDEAVWSWIKREQPTIYLAYGTDDFGMAAHRLLAKGLPPQRVFKQPGRHTWSTWRPLFERVLAAEPRLDRERSPDLAQASSSPAKK